MVKTPANQSAFALIEIVVASIVLGVAVAGILGLVSRALSAQSEGERIETAARLADERLNLVLAVGPEKYPSVFPLAGPCEEPFGDYQHSVTIESQTAGLPYRVRAEVSWAQGTRRRSIMLETLIAPRIGDDPDPDRKPSETLNRSAGSS